MSGISIAGDFPQLPWPPDEWSPDAGLWTIGDPPEDATWVAPIVWPPAAAAPEPPAPERRPFKCPCCDGHGEREDWTFATTTPQRHPCKPCGGTGVLWGPP